MSEERAPYRVNLPTVEPMNEARARKILARLGYDFLAARDVRKRPLMPPACLSVEYLDGYFTADELEAIAWWMRNKGSMSITVPEPPVA